MVLKSLWLLTFAINICKTLLTCSDLSAVKSNNYYSHQKIKALKPLDIRHQEMLDWVKDIAKFSDNTYGAKRI